MPYDCRESNDDFGSNRRVAEHHSLAEAERELLAAADALQYAALHGGYELRDLATTLKSPVLMNIATSLIDTERRYRAAKGQA